MDLSNAKTPQNQTEDDQKEAARIVSRWEKLETAAINWKTHWQECYDVIVPRKDDVIATRLPGDKREVDNFDTTAIQANEMLAAALHGMLTNPETRFFEITFGDPSLDEDKQVKDWCQDVGNVMFRVLNNTNFQTEIYEIYIDLGAIGTACLYMGEHDEDVVYFSARALKEVRVDENSLGLIDTVYRLFKWRPFQIIEEFGEKNCPYNVLQAAEKDSQDQMELIHAVEPQRDDMQKKYKKFKFQSKYILKDSKFILNKDGFREFPYAVPRWSKTSGEVYGRGPGMSMLADINMVNAMMETVIKGAQKTVDPPLMVQDDGVIGVVRLTPGGLTIVRPGAEMIKPLITDARIDFGQKMVEDVRQRIRAGFYVDQLQLQQGPQMTAEEVKQRTEEKLRLMGPVLGRQHFELLRPLITRLFDIMQRRNMIPQAPAKIQGKKFDVRYSSLIARAQRMAEGQNLVRAMQIVQPIAQVIPSMTDGIKGDEVLREVWGIYGLNHKLLESDRDLQQKRDAMAKQKADMLKQQQEQHQADLMNKAAPMISAMGQQGNKP